MKKTQSEANEVVAVAIRKIPPRVFYTAMPQLIAQIMHVNEDTALTVRNILTRVLARFPEQAMWPLAWLRHSNHIQRKKIGEKIFTDSAKHCGEKKKSHESKLLVAATSLLDYLHACAM
jgi:serine/threonine-protein kinase ATR